MPTTLPTQIQPLIDAYLAALTPLQSRFYGIYIYGSIALGAFDERNSDVDIVALTQDELNPSEIAQLEAIHNQLLQSQPLAKRLEIIYLPLANLGKFNNEIAPYPHFADGQFSAAGYGDLNAVTWWLIKHKGVRLWGGATADLGLEVAWPDVLVAMRHNLEGYWAGKAKTPQLFLSDYWVEFGVTTVCRILTAIEDGEIISKAAALERWRNRLPRRFQPLIAEATRLRHRSADPSPYRFRLKRMLDTLALIKYAQGFSPQQVTGPAKKGS